MKVSVELDLCNPESVSDLLFNLQYAVDVLDEVRNGVTYKNTTQDPENVVSFYDELDKAKQTVARLVEHVVSGGLKRLD